MANTPLNKMVCNFNLSPLGRYNHSFDAVSACATSSSGYKMAVSRYSAGKPYANVLISFLEEAATF